MLVSRLGQCLDRQSVDLALIDHTRRDFDPHREWLKILDHAHHLVGEIAAHLGGVGHRLGLPHLLVQDPQLGTGGRDSQIQVLGIIQHGLRVLPGNPGRFLRSLGLLHQRLRMFQCFLSDTSLNLGQHGLRDSQLSFGHLCLRQQERVIQLDQQVSLPHLVSLVGAKRHDATAQFGCHRRLVRLNKA